MLGPKPRLAAGALGRGAAVQASHSLEYDMIKITDAQYIVLSSACSHELGLAVRPASLKPAQAGKMAAILTEKGLAKEIRAKVGVPVWREDEQGREFAFKILKAGRAVVALHEERSAVKDAGVARPAVQDGAEAVVDANAVIHQTNSAGSKGAAIISLMERDAGASMDDLIAATGWLPHTTRAALSRLRKKGITIERSRAEQGGATVYRIMRDATALAA